MIDAVDDDVMDELREMFLREADTPDRLESEVHRAVARRPDLLAPMLGKEDFGPPFWDIVLRYIVPEYSGEIRRSYEREGGTNADLYAQRVVDLLTERFAAYEEAVITRVPQTNQPQRVVYLRRGLDRLAGDFNGKVPAVVNVGTSAGLLESALRVTHPDIPAIGIDRQPRPLTNPDDLRWILSHGSRIEDDAPFFNAIEAYLRDPPRIIQGDGREGIDRAIEVLESEGLIEPDTPIVLFHTMVQMYMTPEEQEDLATLARTEGGRDFYRVFAEVPSLIDDPELEEVTEHLLGFRSVVAVAERPDGSRDVFAVGRPDGLRVEGVVQRRDGSYVLEREAEPDATSSLDTSISQPHSRATVVKDAVTLSRANRVASLGRGELDDETAAEILGATVEPDDALPELAHPAIEEAVGAAESGLDPLC